MIAYTKKQEYSSGTEKLSRVTKASTIYRLHLVKMKSYCFELNGAEFSFVHTVAYRGVHKIFGVAIPWNDSVARVTIRGSFACLFENAPRGDSGRPERVASKSWVWISVHVHILIEHLLAVSYSQIFF